MSITATCGACGRAFIAPPTFQGKRVRCKGCGEIFTVLDTTANDFSAEGPADTDPLAELAAVATSDSSSGGTVNPFDRDDDDEEPLLASDRSIKPGFRPNVLTFDYPGASDVDRWLPLGLIVAGFLLLLACTSGADARGVVWIPVVRFLTPGLLYWACTFPITLHMICKASREQRFMMPPDAKLRCFAAYMPAFLLIAVLQMQGDVFSVSQLFVGILGLIISSGAVWLLFRLREEELGTTLVYGAGGFAAGAVISIAVTLGLNQGAAAIVASQHAQASVPASPFGQGLSWLSSPTAPAAVPSRLAAAPAAIPSPKTPLIAPLPPPVETDDLVTNKIPDGVDGIISPLGDSPYVGVVRAKQGSASIECWNTESWTRAAGTLRLPGLPAGTIVISADGEHLAWIALFPRLSVQIWSFATANVMSTIDLDRSQGQPQLVGFIGNDTLLIERLVPKPAPVVVVTAVPAAVPIEKPAPAVVAPEPKNTNIFDMAEPPPPANPPPSPINTADGTSAKAQQPTGTDDPTDSRPIHQLAMLDITTAATIRRFDLPPLTPQGKSSTDDAVLDTLRYGQNIAICAQTKRIVAAVWVNNAPSLVQFDLATGRNLATIKIAEIDPDQSRMPTGLAYSDNGDYLAALFENGGSALLLEYDAITARKIQNFVYPAGPLDGAPHAAFDGSALCWLDPLPFWLVYGQGVVGTQNGAHLKSADFNVPEASAQRHLEGDRVLLTTNTPAGKRLSILKLDRTKLESFLHAGTN